MCAFNPCINWFMETKLIENYKYSISKEFSSSSVCKVIVMGGGTRHGNLSSETWVAIFLSDIVNIYVVGIIWSFSYQCMNVHIVLHL